MEDKTSFLDRSNLSWLRARTILLVRHGSHAYGTNIATSDEDFKGVAIPSREYFHGFSRVFEQAEFKDPDAVVFDLRKFFSLAADCNPNIIEMLWGDEQGQLIVTPAGRELLDARALFLSRKARWTFSGYAISQLNRIETHRKWLLDPPSAPPSREDYGLRPDTQIPKEQLQAVQAQVQKHLDRWNEDFDENLPESAKIRIRAHIAQYLAELRISAEDRFSAAARTLGMGENFILYLQKEREYSAALKRWDSFRTWKASRNEKRAELEAKFGYDTKHASHLVRLLRMCREILTTGQVIVRRPDAEELRAIRAGQWSYERLIEWARAEEEAMEELYAASPLPRHPDRNRLDELCIRLVEKSL